LEGGTWRGRGAGVIFCGRVVLRSLASTHWGLLAVGRLVEVAVVRVGSQPGTWS
jgi:hypothetical protein